MSDAKDTNLVITEKYLNRANKIVVRRLYNQPIPVLLCVASVLLRTLQETYPGYDVVGELEKLSRQYGVPVDLASTRRPS